MDQWRLFLDTINQFDSDQAWSEFGVEEAALHLDAFSQADWQTLKEVLPSLHDDQLQRIAYVFASGPAPEVCPLLIQLIRLESTDTSLAACDVLRAILEQERATITVPRSVYEYVLNLSTAVPDPWRTSCLKLLPRLLPETRD